ncbi:putative toxin-antitoxin system toxin component, PIN family [bacterium]|nr:putative toxin-antitoxin system toxin component, PIN family [bacterium]MBU1615691.1 putative toxin-antitoxin system toxin component, PIN family [bacterium]
MIEVVFDTNVMVSALLWTGLPHRLLGLVESKEIELCATIEMLNELEVALAYEKFKPRIQMLETTVTELLESMSQIVTIFSQEVKVKVVEIDPDDDIFLSCALSSGAKYLVSGDRHLLDIGSFEEVNILSPRDFYEQAIDEKMKEEELA